MSEILRRAQKQSLMTPRGQEAAREREKERRRPLLLTLTLTLTLLKERMRLAAAAAERLDAVAEEEEEVEEGSVKAMATFGVNGMGRGSGGGGEGKAEEEAKIGSVGYEEAVAEAQRLNDRRKEEREAVVAADAEREKMIQAGRLKVSPDPQPLSLK